MDHSDRMIEYPLKVRRQILCRPLNRHRFTRVNEHGRLRIQSDLGESYSAEYLRNACRHQKTTDHAPSWDESQKLQTLTHRITSGIYGSGVCATTRFFGLFPAHPIEGRREDGDSACCHTDPQAVPLTDTKLTPCRKNTFAADRTTMNDADTARLAASASKPQRARLSRNFHLSLRRLAPFASYLRCASQPVTFPAVNSLRLTASLITRYPWGPGCRWSRLSVAGESCEGSCGSR